MFTKFSKYDFWLKDVNFLGYIISKAMISMDLAKMQAIVEWPQPKTVTKIKVSLEIGGLL